jgi:hypothetical protein
MNQKLTEYINQGYKRVAILFGDSSNLSVLDKLELFCIETNKPPITPLLGDAQENLLHHSSLSLAIISINLSDTASDTDIISLLSLCGITRPFLLPDLVILEIKTETKTPIPYLVDALPYFLSNRITASNYNSWPRNCLRAILTSDTDIVTRHFGPSFPDSRVHTNSLLNIQAYPGDLALIRSRWSTSRKCFPTYLNHPIPIDLEDNEELTSLNAPIREPKEGEISLPATLFTEMGFISSTETDTRNLVSVEIADLSVAERVIFSPLHSLDISEKDALSLLYKHFGIESSLDSERRAQYLISAAEDENTEVTDLESQYLESYCRKAVCKHLPLVVGSIIAIRASNDLVNQMSCYETCQNNYPKDSGWIGFKVESAFPRFQALLVGQDTILLL